ncbi:MAG: hypothetical protein MI810_23275 [Flavobacteriales bacterium]|nr:hypothetical protein [Flavobacteriales bacterium]
MGVDLVGIIPHDLSKKELLDLVQRLDQYTPLKDAAQSWKLPHWKVDLDQKALELIWRYYESDELDTENMPDQLDADIHCSFGMISVFRHTLLVTNWDHKYGCLYNPQRAWPILTVNRLLAQLLDQKEILYCTDSAYPTSQINDKALSGWKYDDLKDFGMKEYGTPPSDLNQARKMMFFLDDLSYDLNDLEEWDGENNPYWFYDPKSRNYVQNKF